MRRRMPRLLWLAIALLAMLGALAVLQYRWLGEVTQAGRHRMIATLHARADQFTEEFDREIARAFFWLQVHPDAFERNEWSSYKDRYERWLAATAYPRLVREIWLFAPGAPPRKFDPAAGSFVVAPLSPALASLASEEAGAARGLHVVRADIPAIVAPVPQVVTFGNTRDVRIEQLRSDAVRPRTVILLDEAYIRSDVLPRLADRAFGAATASEYHVSVRTRQEGREVFSYGPPLQNPQGSPDIALDLFDIRLETIAQLRAASHGGVDSVQLPAAPSVVIRSSTPGADGPRTERFAVSVVHQAGQPGSVARIAVPGPQWQLTVRHRAGSLEAAVAAGRRRNLALSGGILALFASSVILLVVSVQRASRLATQQVEFVAAVSHELRTPLAVIRSAGENLADGVIAEPAHVRRYGELVRNEGTRLSSMVEQVLAFAGMRGDQALRRRPTRVHEVIEQAIAGASPDLADAGMTVEVSGAAGLPAAQLDPDAMARAIANLLSNAAKYAREGGRAWVTVTVVPARSGQELSVAVEDRGPGIADEDLPHIFEPFYRSSHVVASRIRGSGLGLSLVETIARAHRGRVSVRRAAEGGSVFTLHVPWLVADDTVPARQPLPADRP